MKKCGTCKYPKRLKEFSKDKSHKDGRHTVCKTCRATQRAEYYAQNKEAVHARTKAWVKANPERIKEHAKRARQRRAQKLKR